MNLFELFVKIGVDDQASEKIADMNSKLGNGLKTAAKVGLAAVTAAATGVAALATSAIKNFAEYEQLVGGSELMFGKAFDTVKKNAEEAYKTVQMSQNEYLKQVNGFATGLKTALDGNEQAAADLAHRIVKAEADIVAATGNTQENVANAFAGIMKSNFTMLDNLQIGITPTKEGFQEVIDKVNEWNEANGKATKYQMGNLADMQSALVDYIEMVGMSGYAQNEAAGTIQGSLAMTKAAWSNLLTGVADDTADFNALIDNFIESVGAFGDNIIPRVEQSLDGVVKLIDGLLPRIAERIPKFISNYAPKLIKAGVNILKSLVRGIKDNAKMVVNAAKDTVITLIGELPDLLPAVIDAGVELLSGLLEAVPEVATKLFKAAPKIIESLARGLVLGTATIVKAVVGLFVPIEVEAEQHIKNMQNIFASDTAFLDIVEKYANISVDLSKTLSESGRTITEIDEEIAGTEEEITKILKRAFKEQKGLRDQDIKDIEEYQEKIRKLNEEKLGIYRGQQEAEFRKTQLDIEEMDEAQLAEAVGRAESSLKASNEAVENAYSQRLQDVENYHKSTGTINSQAYKNDLNNAKKYRDQQLAQNEQYYDKTLKLAAEKSKEEVLLALEGYQKVGRGVLDWREKIDRSYLDIEGIVETRDVFGLNDDDVARYSKALADLDRETARGFISLQATLKASGEEIDDESKEIIATILRPYIDLPGTFGDTGDAALRNLIIGLESQIPELQNASNMTAEEIIDTIMNYFDEHGEKTGNHFVELLSSGMEGTRGKLVNTGKSLGADAASAFNSSYSAYIAIPSASGGPGGRLMLPKHANGLTYVPYDGYVAELHKGERVLTATQARNYGGATIGNVTINIDGANYDDEETLATVIAEKIQNMTERRAAVYA